MGKIKWSYFLCRIYQVAFLSRQVLPLWRDSRLTYFYFKAVPSRIPSIQQSCSNAAEAQDFVEKLYISVQGYQ